MNTNNLPISNESLKLIGICPGCHGNFELPLNDIYSADSTQECERCGNHGEITMEYNCSLCSNKIGTVLNDW